MTNILNFDFDHNTHKCICHVNVKYLFDTIPDIDTDQTLADFTFMRDGQMVGHSQVVVSPHKDGQRLIYYPELAFGLTNQVMTLIPKLYGDIWKW